MTTIMDDGKRFLRIHRKIVRMRAESGPMKVNTNGNQETAM